MTDMKVLIYIIISGIVCSESARILFMIPTASISHQTPIRPLIQELAKRGHEVVVVTADPAFPKGQAPANLTEIDFHDMAYKIWNDRMIAKAIGKKNDIMIQLPIVYLIITEILEEIYQTPKFQVLMKQKFDLLFLEAWVRPTMALTHVFKGVPVIQISSFGRTFGTYETIGAPTNPLVYPFVSRQKIYNLTLWEKAIEMYNLYTITRAMEVPYAEENAMLKRVFGPDIPDVDELNNNVDMLFLNMHPIWEGNHPVPPSVVYMWGVHKIQPKGLPQDLKTFLDESKSGVIYMSFGSNTFPSMLPPEQIEIFVKVFSKLNYNVLWKWDTDVLPGKTENIKIGKWFPQIDILRHPNVKLFITQAGLQSTDEAITAGVPLLAIPMLGDQWYNAEKIAHHKIGVRLDMEALNEKLFEESVKTIIGDESFRKNVARLRALMNDEPTAPLERVVFWTEHVLRHKGARHLRSPIANMSWTEYLDVQLVSVVLACALAVVCSIIVVAHYLFKFAVRHFVTVKVKKS